jgi:hypothetical protein
MKGATCLERKVFWAALEGSSLRLWQAYYKQAALTFTFTVRFNLSAVGLDNGFDDGQPQPGAADRGCGIYRCDRCGRRLRLRITCRILPHRFITEINI